MQLGNCISTYFISRFEHAGYSDSAFLGTLCSPSLCLGESVPL
uniref:Uncharacterized protein n=1 Tax=Arundo donax TaxID=35708 RepID=A0A0A9ASE9_ARUDO